MKKVILLALLTLALSCCTRPDKAISVLTAQGYTNITITGYHPFACSDSDTFSTGFEAYKDDVLIKGTVCSGLLKGNTIRID